MILFSENIFVLLQRSLQIYFLEAYLTKGTFRLQTYQKWNVNKAIKIYFAFDKLQNLRN